MGSHFEENHEIFARSVNEAEYYRLAELGKRAVDEFEERDAIAGAREEDAETLTNSPAVQEAFRETVERPEE